MGHLLVVVNLLGTLVKKVIASHSYNLSLSIINVLIEFIKNPTFMFLISTNQDLTIVINYLNLGKFFPK